MMLPYMAHTRTQAGGGGEHHQHNWCFLSLPFRLLYSSSFRRPGQPAPGPTGPALDQTKAAEIIHMSWLRMTLRRCKQTLLSSSIYNLFPARRKKALLKHPARHRAKTARRHGKIALRDGENCSETVFRGGGFATLAKRFDTSAVSSVRPYRRVTRGMSARRCWHVGGTSTSLFWYVGASPCNFGASIGHVGASVLPLRRVFSSTSDFIIQFSLSNSLSGACSKRLGAALVQLRRDSWRI